MTITFEDLTFKDMQRALIIIKEYDFDKDIVLKRNLLIKHTVDQFQFDFTFQYDDLESVVVSYA